MKKDPPQTPQVTEQGENSIPLDDNQSIQSIGTISPIKNTLDMGRLPNADVPDLTDVYEVAYQTLEHLAPPFHPFTKDLVIRVENYPDEETMASINITDRNDLLGLYKGIPLPNKGSRTYPAVIDTIYLFRCPLIRHAHENNQDLQKLIAQVMIQEIGHHFGFDDLDMDLDWTR